MHLQKAQTTRPFSGIKSIQTRLDWFVNEKIKEHKGAADPLDDSHIIIPIDGKRASKVDREISRSADGS